MGRSAVVDLLCPSKEILVTPTGSLTVQPHSTKNISEPKRNSSVDTALRLKPFVGSCDCLPPNRGPFGACDGLSESPLLKFSMRFIRFLFLESRDSANSVSLRIARGLDLQIKLWSAAAGDHKMYRRDSRAAARQGI